MTSSEVLREIMKRHDVTQLELANLAGFKNQSNISGFLNASTKGIRLDNLTRLLSALGCSLVVRDDSSGDEWRID